MPRITTRGSRGRRVDARRATTVGLTSLATLTLAPLLTHAKPNERALLLLAAVPIAVLFGYLADYAAGSPAHLETAALQTAQVSGLQLHAAQLQAAQPSAPVIRFISEAIPRSGTGSPVDSRHLAALARPPADQPAEQLASWQRDRLHLVPAPSREASTTGTATGSATGAAPSGLGSSGPHLTLVVTQHPTS